MTIRDVSFRVNYRAITISVTYCYDSDYSSQLKSCAKVEVFHIPLTTQVYHNIFGRFAYVNHISRTQTRISNAFFKDIPVYRFSFGSSIKG